VSESSSERAGRRRGGARSAGAAGQLTRWAALLLALVAAGLGAACSNASVAGDDTGLAPLVGEWRGVLLTPGGELPFRLRVAPESGEPPAVVINAGDEQPLAAIARQGAASYTLRFFDDADSELVAKMSPDGDELSGYWRRNYAPPDVEAPVVHSTQMPFAASRDDARRFQRNDPALEVATPQGIAALPDVSGEWSLQIRAEMNLPSDLLLTQDDEHVTAEFGRPPGEGLRLEGIYRNGLLRLSLFDGMRALLLHARALPDGTLRGTVWAENTPASPFTATRADGDR